MLKHLPIYRQEDLKNNPLPKKTRNQDWLQTVLPETTCGELKNQKEISRFQGKATTRTGSISPRANRVQEKEIPALTERALTSSRSKSAKELSTRKRSRDQSQLQQSKKGRRKGTPQIKKRRIEEHEMIKHKEEEEEEEEV